MADSKKLRIFPSQAGQLGISTVTSVPSLGTATRSVFKALTGMTDAGFIPITLPNADGVETEYYIPIIEAN